MHDAEPSEPSHGFFHPTRPGFRFTVLLFVGLLPFGSYFAYDATSALGDTLMKEWQTDERAFGGLYTAYSLAAIPSLIVCGILVDRIGTRRASLIFSLLVVAGASIVAAAGSIQVAWVGRLVFGAGSEALIVAQSAMLARWFRGRELALSFGIALAIARLGTLFSFNTLSRISDSWGWRAGLWVAAGLCVFSVAMNLVYFALDRKGERALLLHEVEAGDRIVWGQVFKFRASYWYLVGICVTFYSAIFPFTAFSTSFFKEKWGLPATVGEAGSFLEGVFWDFLHMFTTAPGTSAIPIFASMLIAPFAGGLVDRFGHRATLMIGGSVLLALAHGLLGFTHLPPQTAMMILGAGFVLVPAALWPAVPLLVEKGRTGTAFGLMTMLQNIGLALFPYLNGALRRGTGDYTASMGMFVGLGIVGLVLSFLLRAADAREGGTLERGKTAAG